jgi:deazaflavin-dependent oxidoreductase (nitroreductase family)
MRITVPRAMYGGDLAAVDDQVVTEYRDNGGRLTTAFAGAPVLRLTHRGASSGRADTSPLAHSRAGDDSVVIASMGAAAVDPRWYRNLVAHPDIEIEVGSEKIPVRARVATGEGRERLFRAQAEETSDFDDHPAGTTRQLPVIVFERGVDRGK